MYMLIKTEIYSFQMNFDHQNGYYKWSQTFEKSFAYWLFFFIFRKIQASCCFFIALNQNVVCFESE